MFCTRKTQNPLEAHCPMKRFITRNNKALKLLLAAAFWIAVWQLMAVIVGEELFVASPLTVLKTLARLVATRGFWVALANSFLKITSGFLLAVIGGVGLAVLSARFTLVKTLAAPLASIIKATPVVSFIILAVISVGSKNLSILISFLMVLPVIYINTLGGIEQTDAQLLEMARVFRVSRGKKLRYIYAPGALPSFLAGCSVGLGLCWKSGVAAEVIGLSANTLGHKLYESKLYLDTAELFAYTAVIIAVSFAFEKLFMRLLRAGTRRLTGGGAA